MVNDMTVRGLADKIKKCDLNSVPGLAHRRLRQRALPVARHGNKVEVVRLDAEGFIRSPLLHALLRAFIGLRHYTDCSPIATGPASPLHAEGCFASQPPNRASRNQRGRCRCD